MQGSESAELEKYTDVFEEGLGMLKGTSAKIYGVSDQPPTFFKPRLVPYSLKEG